MQHSALCMRNPDGSLRTLVPRGGLAGAVLLQFQVDFPNEFLWIEIDSEARLGQAQDPLNSVPVYACVKAVLSPHEVTKVEALEINYLTFFAYNGSYTVAGLIETGHHDGDWEHWTARIHPRSGELLGAWYNAHRGRDGEWVPASAVPRTPSGRPIAYVALHGHGNYPRVSQIVVLPCLLVA